MSQISIKCGYCNKESTIDGQRNCKKPRLYFRHWCSAAADTTVGELYEHSIIIKDRDQNRNKSNDEITYNVYITSITRAAWNSLNNKYKKYIDEELMIMEEENEEDDQKLMELDDDDNDQENVQELRCFDREYQNSQRESRKRSRTEALEVQSNEEQACDPLNIRIPSTRLGLVPKRQRLNKPNFNNGHNYVMLPI